MTEIKGIQVLKRDERLIIQPDAPITQEDFNCIVADFERPSANIFILPSQFKIYIVPRDGDIELKKD